MANPRIDDLRKKLEKEPGSRLFAQLAEELRKDGDLAEAIRVSRQGLGQHPNYPSARMTLGRALLDAGDLEAARKEFETVLKGAADNILASRFLAECLEGLGESAGALQRYRSTLALAPGDKQIQTRIQALEKAAAPAAATAAAPARAPEPARAAVPTSAHDTDPPPIRLVEVDGPMELVTRFEEAHPPPPTPAEPAEDIYIAPPAEGPRLVVAPRAAEAPVPLVPVDEAEFELERPYEAPAVAVRPLPGEGTPSPTPAAAPPPGTPLADEDDEPVLEADAVDEEPAPPSTATADRQHGTREPEPVTLEPDVIVEEFEVDTQAPAAGAPRVTFRDILADPGVSAEALAAAWQSAPAPPPVREPEAPAAPGAVPPAAAAPPPELASPTLAELYFDQGFPDKAVEVYRRLLEREPDNDRLRSRMREIESARTAAPAVAAPAWPPGSRQEAIVRVIERLQDLRTALARRN